MHVEREVTFIIMFNSCTEHSITVIKFFVIINYHFHVITTTHFKDFTTR